MTIKNKKSRIALFSLAILFFVFPKSASFSPINPPSLSADQITALTNKIRRENNLPLLSISNELMETAEYKARDMLTYHYFSHVGPKDNSPWEIFDQENYFYRVAGENLAVDFNSSQEVMAAWLSSATHRANILDPSYQEIGVAIIPGYFNHRNTSIIVQHFGTLASDIPK